MFQQQQKHWKAMEMHLSKRLTKRENQIAGLAFCGLAKKEMADRLHVAYGTINVLLDKAYKKTGTSKLNELGSWWANRVFTLNIDFSTATKNDYSSLLLGNSNIPIFSR